MQTRASNKAFTLIELLVVISIIALLSSVVLASLNAARDKARLAAAKQFYAQTDRIAGSEAMGIWDFDECSGSNTLNKATGGANSISGAVSWSTNTPTGSGCSLSFNGSTTYIDTGFASDSIGAQAFTMSAWFNASSVSASDNQGWRRVISRSTGNSGTRASISIDGGQVCLHVDGGTLYGCQAVSAGTWYHVAGVWLPSGSPRWRFYLDGREVAAGGNALSSADSSPIRIGIGPTGTERFFHGLLDGVRIFERALTAADVRYLYLAGAASDGFAAR